EVDQTTSQHFPGAGMQQIERAAGIAWAQDDAQCKRRQEKPQNGMAQYFTIWPKFPDRHQNDGEQQVELPLNRERPGVQEPFFMGGGIKIPGLLPKPDVGNEDDGPDAMRG